MENLNNLTPKISPFNKVNIFISYSREDLSLQETLIENLIDNSLREVSNVFVDNTMNPGSNFDKSIKEELLRTDIFIMLLTSNFIKSEYCMRIELPFALADSKIGATKIYAIILEEGEYDQLLSLGDIKVYPENRDSLKKHLKPTDIIKQINLDLKYYTYNRFEARNREFKLDYDGNAECELIFNHSEGGRSYYENKKSRFGGDIVSNIGTIGIILSSFYLINYFQTNRFFPLFVFYSAIIITSRIILLYYSKFFVATSGKLKKEINKLDGYDWSHVLLTYIRDGLILGPILILIGIWLFDDFRIIYHSIVILFLNNWYFEKFKPKYEKKRLEIYHDLMKKGLEPQSGWIIDQIEKDFKDYRQKVYNNKWEKEEKLFQERLESLSEESEGVYDYTTSTQENYAFEDQIYENINDVQDSDLQNSTDEDPRPLILIVTSKEDNSKWKELNNVFINEGVNEVCQFEVLHNLSESFNPQKYAHILPFITDSFNGSEQEDKLNEYLIQKDYHFKEILPVFWDDVDPKDSLFYNILFLPEGGIPIVKWPIKRQALIHIAKVIVKSTLYKYESKSYHKEFLELSDKYQKKKNLDGIDLYDYIHKKYDQRSIRFRKMRDKKYKNKKFDYNFLEMVRWAIIHFIIGLLTGIWVTFSGFGNKVLDFHLLIYAIPLIGSVFLQYKELKRYTDNQHFIGAKENWRNFLKAMLYVVPAVIIFPFVIYFFSFLYEELNYHSLKIGFKYIEVGYISWFILGICNYFLTRRKRPKIKIDSVPPTISDPLIEFSKWKLYYLTAFEDQTTIKNGDIGKIKNTNPQIALEYSYGHEISIKTALKLFIEGGITVGLGWFILAGFNPEFKFPIVKFYFGFIISMFTTSFLCSIYTFIRFDVIKRKVLRVLKTNKEILGKYYSKGKIFRINMRYFFSQATIRYRLITWPIFICIVVFIILGVVFHLGNVIIVVPFYTISIMFFIIALYSIGLERIKSIRN